MESIFYLFIFAFIASVAGLIGGVVLLFKEKWAKILASFSVPLAAGVLLSLSLLDLFPEAVEESGSSAFTIILLVFIVLFIIERFFFYLHHHSEEGEKHTGHGHGSNQTSVALVVVGDSVHNFLDGIVIGVTFLADPHLALLVGISTFLHETPHEIADFGILLAKGWSRKKAFLVNFLSALTTFPGAFLAYYFADAIESATGFLLSVATGFFLYVATTDFLPEATHAPRKYMGQQVLFLLLGVLIIAAIRLLFPEIGH